MKHPLHLTPGRPLPPPGVTLRPAKRLPMWAIIVIAVVGGLIVYGGLLNGGDREYHSPLDPSAQTCLNLQRLIDGGLTKRMAIEYAVLQADEPSIDGDLRRMLGRCP